MTGSHVFKFLQDYTTDSHMLIRMCDTSSHFNMFSNIIFNCNVILLYIVLLSAHFKNITNCKMSGNYITVFVYFSTYFQNILFINYDHYFVFIFFGFFILHCLLSACQEYRSLANWFRLPGFLRHPGYQGKVSLELKT